MTHIFTRVVAGHKKTTGLYFPAAAVENHLQTSGDPDGGAAAVRKSSRIPSFCYDPAVMLCWEKMNIKPMQPG